MRDNLLFYNMLDARDESDDECANKLYSFFEEKLNIDNASDIKLDRVHRLGRYNPAKTRPIIAKFCFYPDRETVRKAARNLAGTQYFISQQFPKEVMARRKRLIPTLKSLKDQGRRVYISDRSMEATIKYNCSLKWNELYKTAFIKDLTKDAHLLQDIVHEDVSIDLMVDKFSTFITDHSNVSLKKISQIRSETVFTCADKKEKKLWYDKHCLSKNKKFRNRSEITT